MGDIDNILKENRNRIINYLVRLVGHREAEDLTQEVLVRISRAHANFRGESKLSTWIYRIATNAALDKLRSPTYRVMQDRIDSIDSDQSAFQELAKAASDKNSDGDIIECDLIKTEMNSCIRKLIDKLPDSYRIPIILSDLEGMKNQEIAEVLQISLATVKIRLHRGRSKLKEMLKGSCDFYSNIDGNLACTEK